MNLVTERITPGTIEYEWWNTDKGVRLLGHVIEYFALGLAAGIAFRKKWLAFIICMFISFADQIIKIFVPIRHFDAGDIPYTKASCKICFLYLRLK